MEIPKFVQQDFSNYIFPKSSADKLVVSLHVSCDKNTIKQLHIYYLGQEEA